MNRQVVFRSKWLPYALVLPQLIITVVFFFLPAYQSIVSSFYREDAFGSNKTFVGLQNYIALFHNDTYYQSIWVTIIFSVAVTLIGLVLALILALMADRVVRGAKFYKTFLIIPYAIAPALIGTLVAFLLSPSIGIVSVFMHHYFGIDWNPNLNPKHALIMIIGAAIWAQISYNFLFFLAGLQGIPRSLIEASAIDGASFFQRSRDIVIPLLAPTTFFLFVINVIYAFFETFAIIDITTRGGPGNSTTTLVYSVYKSAFQAYDYGSSGAQSVILMLAVILLTIVQFKYIEKKIHY